MAFNSFLSLLYYVMLYIYHHHHHHRQQYYSCSCLQQAKLNKETKNKTERY